MITRDDFIRAIKLFEKKHGPLEQCLSKNPPEATVRALLENPIIHGYLARDVTKVQFADTHPLLTDSDNPEENDRTDHHELRIYKLLPNVVAYREGSINTAEFYKEGTNKGGDKLFKEEMELLNKQHTHINAGDPRDIYRIATYIRGYDFAGLTHISPQQTAVFLLSPNWKDSHASTIVSIIDPVTQRVLLSLFLNSAQNDTCYEYSKPRFLGQENWSTRTMPHHKSSLFDYVKRIFPEAMNDSKFSSKPPTLVMNSTENAALLVNYTDDDYDSEQYLAFIKQYKNHTIFHVKDGEMDIRYRRQIPFLDVSHHLQTEEDDMNCALYGLNFIQAITTLLTQPAIAAQVIEHARTIYQQGEGAPLAIDAENKLKTIFKEQLKAYLPAYYSSENGEKRVPTALREFHLKQRWILGQHSLDYFYPIKEVMGQIEHVKNDSDQITQTIQATLLNFEASKLLTTIQFDNHIHIINQKASKMEAKQINDKGYKLAAIAARTLHTHLFTAQNNFLQAKISKTEFKEICGHAITDAKKELSKHRGWSEIIASIGNALLFLCTASISWCALGRYRYFQPITDSMQKLNALDQCMQIQLS